MSPHRTPDRVRHMLGTAYLAELLSPTYARINHREAVDVYAEVKLGLEASGLHQPLCDALWRVLQHQHPGRGDATVLDNLAAALAGKAGLRRAAAKEATAARMNAFFVSLDTHLGRASEATRRALDTPNGQMMLKKSLVAVAEFLAARW